MSVVYDAATQFRQAGGAEEAGGAGGEEIGLIRAVLRGGELKLNGVSTNSSGSRGSKLAVTKGAPTAIATYESGDRRAA